MGTFSRDTWQAEQARLASFVSPEQLMRISYAYSLFPNGQSALDTLRRGGPGNFARELFMVNHVGDAIQEAAWMLRPTVWSPAEQKRLDTLAAQVRAAEQR
jgi:hypothetical protein